MTSARDEPTSISPSIQTSASPLQRGREVLSISTETAWATDHQLTETSAWSELKTSARTTQFIEEPEDETGDLEERENSVRQIMELQNNLRTLITRVESVKAEHDSLQSENQILQKYINNLMTNTAIFSASGGNAK